MNVECRRWVELTDLEALGEPLPNDQRAFQRAHEASCAECAREAAVWRALKVPAPDFAPGDEDIKRVLALATAGRRSRFAILLPQPWKRAAVAAAAVACAAASLLWVGGRLERAYSAKKDTFANATPPSAPAPSAVPATNTAMPAAPPAESGTEPSCSQVVAGATVCLARGAAIASRALDGPDRALELARGRAVVSLAPQPPGTSFSLTTTVGKVTAVGTIFSVEVRPDGATIARVIEGHVLVKVGEAVARSLRAGQALRLGEQRPSPLSDEDRSLDLGLLALAGSTERDSAHPSKAGKLAELGVVPAASPDMLEYARSLRASGDFRGAAEVYRKIHADSPQSPSGRAALVSLGELLLSLGDAEGALNAFDAYLAGGGALAQEATFGRTRALRALDRPAEERRAIERFLVAYPNAPQSRVLRSRLAAMQK